MFFRFVYLCRVIKFKDNLRTIEARFPKNLRTIEAQFELTGPYKKVYIGKEEFPKSTHEINLTGLNLYSFSYGKD